MRRIGPSWVNREITQPMIGSSKIKLSGQQGQALALAIIVVAITGLLAVPVLSLSSSVLHRSAASRATLHEQYSVDAGTEDAIWRITYEEGFLSKVLDESPPAPYPIIVNGAETLIEVKPYEGQEPPAPEQDPPEENPGINILMWTTVEPPLINLADATATVTIHIQNSNAPTEPMIERLIEVLPAGFRYIEGTLKCKTEVDDECEGLHWQGAPDQILTIEAFTDPSIFEREELGPGIVLTGGDPRFPLCEPKVNFLVEPDEGGIYQKLEWTWPNGGRPVVEEDQTVEISFDMALPVEINIDNIPWSDSPYLDTTQDACPGAGLEAGQPLDLSGFLITLITATQGNTALDSLVQFVFPGPDIEIQSQRYGRSEEP